MVEASILRDESFSSDSTLKIGALPKMPWSLTTKNIWFRIIGKLALLRTLHVLKSVIQIVPMKESIVESPYLNMGRGLSVMNKSVLQSRRKIARYAADDLAKLLPAPRFSKSLGLRLFLIRHGHQMTCSALLLIPLPVLRLDSLLAPLHLTPWSDVLPSEASQPELGTPAHYLQDYEASK